MILEELVAAVGPDGPGERRLLLEQVAQLAPDEQDQLLEGLKQQADQLMRTDVRRCIAVSDLMLALAQVTGNPLHRALGLLAIANAHNVALGEYRQAVEYYDRAAEIYAAQGEVVRQAQSQIGKIHALAQIGRYSDALEAGEWARKVLRDHQEWFHLARLKVNLAIIHARLGQDTEALALFDLARESYRQMGIEGEPHWLRIELNRAVVLRNLGRFEEAIEASRTAMEMHRKLGQEVAAARAQQTLAVTYFVLGRYNEALALLEEAREILQKDGRLRHAMLVELFISDCLLQLRRFPDVLEKCRSVRALFSELGTRYEVAQAILNEASAYTGLARYPEALASIGEARRLFEQEGNPVAVADSDLQAARVSLELGQPEASLSLAQGCAEVYQAHDLPVWQARAYLVAGRAALACGKLAEARGLVSQALAVGEAHHMPVLTYPSRHLLGQLAIQAGDPRGGLACFDRAIQELELVCGRMMVEFRANFIEDKERIYQDTVGLCLDLGEDLRGLEYAERAKSRALLDLLAYRLDLSITARSEADLPLVEELGRLRNERDHYYRRLESGDGYGQRGDTGDLSTPAPTGEQKVLEIEKRITGLWHKLLIRNADYARDASMWQVRTEPIQPYLDPDTLLLEYYVAQGRLVVFRVTAGQVKAVRLPTDLPQVQRSLQLLWLNLKTVPRSAPERLAALSANAQGILSKLYQQLIAPLAGEAPEGDGPALRSYRRLVIVPHGPLHYLPFQALHDGQSYLLEGREVSYLPGASFLRYSREARPSGQGLLCVGHSYQGRLPYTLQEASAIAGMWPGQAMLEEQATLAQFRAAAPGPRLLHLAAHGDFRPDNPLFSGLALADGWLTTLDVFNLRLNASLVTLSACQTGRSVVGGGDELLGLMRSFLAAGAASLVSTLWAVEDHSTARLMQAFYQNLAAGQTKGAALQQAQLGLLHDPIDGDKYQHPYFWAPFFLVGDAGYL
ncbi:MAG TPA: CHAT domain-containing tetratricopeptide repeat protein [Anaerolineales bacterium]